jgi:hypothetical protein
MPWTFAHPAAVLPFLRLPPSTVNFTALVVGSITPDLGYYVGQFSVATLAHTFRGSFLVCLPSGFVLLAIVYLLRKPIWFVLPQPHRGALEAMAYAPSRVSVRWIFVSACSILAGAWTHIVWDSFTHADGWSVGEFPALRTVFFNVGGMDIALYSFLQLLSTIVGLAAVVAAYLAWLRRRREVTQAFVVKRSDGWRWSVLVAAAVAALTAAAAMSMYEARALDVHATRMLLFHAALSATSVFAVAFALFAVFCYAARRKHR